MKKKTAPASAAPVEIMPPTFNISVFPPRPRTLVNHADALFMVLFRWALLALSVAGWACSVGVLVIAAAVLVPALAFGGIAWALHRTAALTR